MLYRNMFLKYQAPQEDGGEGAPPADAPKPSEKEIELQAELDRIRSHHNKLLDETKAAKAAKQQQEEATRLAAEEAARKSGDVEALEKSWQGKYTKLESESKANADKLQSQINSMLVDGVASLMAAELAVDADVADLLAEQIKKSLGVTERDGKQVTAVLEDGKPSAMTIDELKKSVANNPKFSRLVKGSLAGGAGSLESKPSGGAGGNNASGSMVDRARKHIKANS